MIYREYWRTIQACACCRSTRPGNVVFPKLSKHHRHTANVSSMNSIQRKNSKAMTKRYRFKFNCDEPTATKIFNEIGCISCTNKNLLKLHTDDHFVLFWITLCYNIQKKWNRKWSFHSPSGQQTEKLAVFPIWDHFLAFSRWPQVSQTHDLMSEFRTINADIFLNPKRLRKHEETKKTLDLVDQSKANRTFFSGRRKSQASDTTSEFVGFRIFLLW